MHRSARTLAEIASFQAFINCYLRELNCGNWQDADVWLAAQASAPVIYGDQVLLIKLPGTSFVFDVSYRSQVGPHKIEQVFRSTEDGLWQRESFWSVLLFLVKDLYANQQLVESNTTARKQLELTYRLTDSLQNMANFISHWQANQQKVDNFISAEQSLVFGHWLHPTPKSRQGCLEWQQPLFSPELQAGFQLRLFAINRDFFIEADSADRTNEKIVREVFSIDDTQIPEDMAPIPVHPLQAQWLLYQPEIEKHIESGKIQDMGPQGPRFYATSSMRTVWNESLEWMFKLSIPVKLTNSMRQNRFHELQAGCLVGQLIDSLNFSNSYSKFKFITDPGYVTATIPGRDESGFECIIRENPFTTKLTSEIFSVAALTQDSLSGVTDSLLAKNIRRVSITKKITLKEASLLWMYQYWQCVIEPCIRLFDLHGIALEAHQQNILIACEDGLPKCGYFRDNQGFYLSKECKVALLERLPSLSDVPELFYDNDMIIKRFGYYLVINQLFSVVYRLGAEKFVEESILLRFIVNQLRALYPRLGDKGSAFVDYILLSPSLSTKANLLTRVKDIDELDAELEMAVYVDFDNPIAAVTASSQVNTVVEYA